jgi:CopA family copper-resistance protein
MELMNKIQKTLLLCGTLLIFPCAFASEHEVNLEIGYKLVDFAGDDKQAITANQQIPAPTLYFKEGDHVIINVHNQLDQETALHWHGILVPWQMDGVKGVNQEGIPPGKSFRYEFTLEQSGTYWYHAHAGLQEQQGLYGAFIIEPAQPASYKYTNDYVIVLSDWSNTNPDQILRNLKNEGDYYSSYFPLQPSLAKFIHDYNKSSEEGKEQLIDDYQMMQKMRMSIYDFSDVAYDAFLLNGKSNSDPWTGAVAVGDIVRLRFIGAGGSTIFRVKIPGTPMQMVHVQGNDVVAYDLTEFTIAPGETYDVLVKIQEDRPYIIYAESKDTLGAAYGALTTSRDQVVHFDQVPPFPEPLPVTREMMALMMGEMMQGSLPSLQSTTSMTGMGTMDMSHDGTMSGPMIMDMPTESTIIGDSISPPTDLYSTSTGTKYKDLVSAVKTNDPNKLIEGVITMELFGYMERYIWFINGVPEHEAAPIVLEPGKRYRFVFTNTSMMHHPMHIHGHWFIFRKGNDAYDPLLHTIDVPPGGTITADVDTDASGQWIFHCHLLYHMVSGMSREIQYSTLLAITEGEAKPESLIEKTAYYNRPIVRVDEIRPINPELVKHPMPHDPKLWFATFLDVGANPATEVVKLNLKGLYGADYDKLELFINDAEMNKGNVEFADMDIFYWRLINQFWAVKAGVNYFYRPAETPYWQPGVAVEGLLPYFIDTDIRMYYYGGSAKLDIELSRDSQMTNKFFIRAGIRSLLASKTVDRAELGSGLNQMRYLIRPFYRVSPQLDLFAEFEYEQYYGEFRDMQIDAGDSSSQSLLTFGASLLF